MLAQWKAEKNKKQARKRLSQTGADSSAKAQTRKPSGSKEKEKDSSGSKAKNKSNKNKDSSASLSNAKSCEGALLLVEPATATSVNTDEIGRPSSNAQTSLAQPNVEAQASDPTTTQVSGPAQVIDLSSIPGPSGIRPGSSIGMQDIQSAGQDPSGAIRDLLLASESASNRDFEGFSDQPSQGHVDNPRRGRSRSRSRRKHKGRRRRHSSSSSSSSSSSPSRRHRRKRRSKKVDNSESLSQILSILTAMTRPAAQSQVSSNSQPVPPHPSSAQEQASPVVPPRGDSPIPDSDQDQEAVDLLSVMDNPQSEGEREFSEGSEDEPLFGTDIPADVFDRAVTILREQLGFDSNEQDVNPPSKSKSKLSLNRQASSSRASLPVDAECEDRYKATAATATADRWTAFSKSQCSSFRVDEKEWKDLFKTPSIPQAADDYLRSVGSLDPAGKLRSITNRRSLRSFGQIDTAARTGLKFSSALLLIAEVLMKSFKQAGSSEVSRRDTATLVSLVGPIARRVYDQFARVSVKAVMDRRELVLDAMRLPAKEVKRRFRQLPITGADIFGGQFDAQLQTEVKRKKDMQQANLSNPRFQSPALRSRGRPSQFQRGRYIPSSRRAPAPAPTAPRQQRQPQRSYGRQPGRGYSRGSSTGRGRGFSRP